MTIKKLQWIESSVFFIVCIIIMLIGADFPPPIGFIWVILGIFLLAALQWFYLGWLMKALTRRKTFALNLVLFSSVGLLTALLAAALNGKLTHETAIWFVLITIAAAIYGCIFRSVNMLIAKKMGI